MFDPWPWWASGGAIGLFVTIMAWVTGKLRRVSSGCGSVCAVGSRLEYFQSFRQPWKLWLIAGIPLDSLAAALLGGRWDPTFDMGTFETVFGPDLWVKAVMLVQGGGLIGWGARWAGGCTSGHSIAGIAQGAKASLIVTLGFMAAGMAVSNLVFRLFP